jgi:cyclopropane fatty-acyl-phospholipid synthase-like methyltransferase
MIRRLFFELKYLLGNPPWDTGISPPELQAYLESTPAGRAIDLGCGTGTNALTMAEHGWQVLGVDLSPIAIRRARVKAASQPNQATFKRMDVARLPGVEGPFDLALDIGCYHSLPAASRGQYRARLEALLPPGADYLLYAWLTEPGDGAADAASVDEINEAFKAGFTLLSLEEGRDHGRKSAWFKMRRRPT